MSSSWKIRNQHQSNRLLHVHSHFMVQIKCAFSSDNVSAQLCSHIALGEYVSKGTEIGKKGQSVKTEKGSGIKGDIYRLTLLNQDKLTVQSVNWMFLSSIRLLEGKLHKILLWSLSFLHTVGGHPIFYETLRRDLAVCHYFAMKSKVLIAGGYFIFSFLKNLFL